MIFALYRFYRNVTDFQKLVLKYVLKFGLNLGSQQKLVY